MSQRHGAAGMFNVTMLMIIVDVVQPNILTQSDAPESGDPVRPVTQLLDAVCHNVCKRELVSEHSGGHGTRPSFPDAGTSGRNARDQ